jgi:hypothetical protein
MPRRKRSWERGIPAGGRGMTPARPALRGPVTPAGDAAPAAGKRT